MRILANHGTPLLLTFGSVILVSSACGGGSSSNSSGSTSTGGTGGIGVNASSTASSTTTATTSSTTASGAGGAGGAVTNAGGTEGSTVTSSVDAGGSAGEAGAPGSDSGGTNGGDGGSAGSAGSGGTGPTGAIGILGEPCDSPGDLACAGNHQKLTVVCGGDGEWEVNETCGATEYCDSVEGQTTGLCLEPDAACAGGETELQECIDGDVVSCAPDGIRQATVEDCVGPCEAGECLNDRDPCIAEGLPSISCAETCGPKDVQCPGTSDLPVSIPRPSGFEGTAFRTASYANAPPIECGENTRGHLLLVGYGPYRVTAPEPWRLYVGTTGDPPCGLTWSSCAVVADNVVIWVLTEDPTASERNVTFELLEDPTATCPE